MTTPYEAILITGGSSGIGLELAKLFAKDGQNLVLVARDQKKLLDARNLLETNYKTHVDVISCDLSKPNAAEFVDHTVKNLDIEIHGLVNNAGSALYGAFATNAFESELALIQIYIVTPSTLCKIFLPRMLERKRGKILNVISMAAFQPMPFMAVYSASKAYLLHFTEALSSESAKSGVTVTAVCPCATKTDGQKTANVEDWLLVQGKMMDASVLARKAYRGLNEGKRVIIPDVRSQFLYAISRLAPRDMTLRLAKYVIEARSERIDSSL